MHVLDSSMNVCDTTYMGERLTGEVKRALELLPMPRFAEGTGKAYPTIQAYKYGQRAPTPQAARDIAAYLRSQAVEYAEVADALDAAADAEADR